MGVWMITKSLLRDIDNTIPYKKYFKFDDVFIGITAHKLKVEPISIASFYIKKVPYDRTAFRTAFTSPGYGNRTNKSMDLYLQPGNKHFLTVILYGGKGSADF